jgi:hypothetical protein
MCLIKAIVSTVIFVVQETPLDLCFQARGKSSRCQREPCLWLHDQKGILPGTHQPGQQDEQDAIGPGDCWPFHLPLEDDELLVQEA